MGRNYLHMHGAKESPENIACCSITEPLEQEVRGMQNKTWAEMQQGLPLDIWPDPNCNSTIAVPGEKGECM